MNYLIIVFCKKNIKKLGSFNCRLFEQKERKKEKIHSGRSGTGGDEKPSAKAIEHHGNRHAGKREILYQPASGDSHRENLRGSGSRD